MSEAEAEANVPLDNIVSDTPSPRPRSFMHPDISDRTMKPKIDNPFEPPSSPSDLQRSSVMYPSSDPPTPKASKRIHSLPTVVEGRPVLEASSSFSRQPPPAPEPVDLPPPRSPPPRPNTAAANRPPEPHPRPVIDYNKTTGPEEALPEVKWWTEWLCGCSEGPNRGGDTQVRSNFLACAPLAPLLDSY